MSEWNMLVKRVFADGKKKNAAYRLGDAMKDAKKLYKKTTDEVGGVASKVASSLTQRRSGKRRSGKRRFGKRRTSRK